MLTFSSMTVRVLIIRFTLYEDFLSLSLSIVAREEKNLMCCGANKKGTGKVIVKQYSHD